MPKLQRDEFTIVNDAWGGQDIGEHRAERDVEDSNDGKW